MKEIAPLLTRALEQGPDPMMITDPGGKIQYVNKRFLEITGYRTEEILGKNTRIFSSGKTPPETYRKLWKTILSGQVWEGELLNKKKNGKLYWESISIAPLQGANGSISNFVASFKDISQKKQIEKELEKLTANLNSSNKELEEFAYAASHDLQEPLAIVRMYLELLQGHLKNRLDEDAVQYIEIAKKGAEDCQKLIRDILEYSRIGKNERVLEATDFESILEHALADLKLSISESGAEITHDPLPRLGADSSQMLRLFRNLLSNALKYHGEEPPKIHIGAGRSGQEWIFAVKDNGIGIDAKDRDRVFAVFQRLHSKAECSGSGVGLAICKKIVEHHGGRIWLQSGNGVKGTVFYFSLPL